MKKKNLLYIVCALAMGSLCGCDDFLNKDPQDKQTNDTYWQTETSLRTYAQDFYSTLQDMVPTILFLPVISLEMTIRMILSI